ncbi:hypothetical protein CEV33_2873 [Brucella grignonensis]|uniref:Uncharacterized protein n=1 Tax=Brucella grignonensis TaxID=94627 RepID=A0A256F2S1_9HYPH|nr:hypothetical protein CEV33_2873 [Brucella grignonensis]
MAPNAANLVRIVKKPERLIGVESAMASGGRPSRFVFFGSFDFCTMPAVFTFQIVDSIACYHG